VAALPVPEGAKGWRAVVTPAAGGRGVDAVVVDDAGNIRIRLEGYETIALPGALDAGLLRPLQETMG